MLLDGSGQDILLVHHNPKTVSIIRRNGVRLHEGSGKVLRARLDIKRFLTKNDKPDLVLLTVKSYDTRSAAASLKRVLAIGTPIMSLQNGLGNIETLTQYFPRSTILAGVTTEPALLIRTGLLKRLGSGATWIGEFGRTASRLCETIEKMFRRAGFRTKVMTNIRGAIWAKAIVNSAINPVSALARVSNGDVLGNRYLKKAALMLLREGVAVARASRVSPSPSPRAMLMRTLRSTEANKSSMLRDIESGRKTEIRELNGAIARYGEKLGISVPRNSLVTKLVLGLEPSKAKSDRRALRPKHP